MSTLENLFVQVFERKRWIVDQVKQQRDLFDQSLASNAFINGFHPPSWLLSSRFEVGSADLKELKKEDLISSFLFPPTKQNYPSTGRNNFMYKTLFSEKNVQDALGKDYYNVGDTSMLVPDSEGITSAPHRTEARLSDAKIQLDKSQSRSRKKVSRDITRLCLDNEENDVLEKNCFNVGESLMLVPEDRLDEDITADPHRTEARLSDAKSRLDKSQSRSPKKVARDILENEENNVLEKNCFNVGESSMLVPDGCLDEDITAAPNRTEVRLSDAKSQLDKSRSRSPKKVARVSTRLCLENEEKYVLEKNCFNVGESSMLDPEGRLDEDITGAPHRTEAKLSNAKSQLHKSRSRSWKKVPCGTSRLCFDTDEFPDARDSSMLVPRGHTDEAISSPLQTEAGICETGSQLDKSRSRSQQKVVCGTSRLCFETDEFLDARDSSTLVPMGHTSEAISSPPQTEARLSDAKSQLDESRSRSRKKGAGDLGLENDELLDARDSSMLVSMCHTNEAISSPPQTEAGICGTGSQLDKSRARMQRSRSRQKALEIRQSKSAEVKSGEQPMQTYDSAFTGRLTRPKASGGLSTDARDLPEQHNVSNIMNEASCRVTRHGSDTFHVNSSDKPLQPPKFVDEEDVLPNISGSQDPSRSPKFAEKDNLNGANREEHPSKVEITDKCCSRSQTACVDCADGLQKLDSSEPVSSGRVPPSQLPSSKKYSRSGLAEFSVPRTSLDDNMVIEPKQLSFEVEDCISNGRFAPHHTNEKGNGSLDRDGMHGPTESLRKDTLFDDIHSNHDTPFLDENHESEAVNKDEELRAPSDVHEELSLGFIGSEKFDPDFYHTCSVGPSNLSIPDESICESKFINSKLNAPENSWPQYKRRKIEDRSSNVFRTHPRSLRLEPLHQIAKTHIPEYYRTGENGLKTDMKQKHVSSFSGSEVHHSHGVEGYGARISESAKRRKTDSYGLSPRSQAKEGDIVMEDTNMSTNCKQTRVEPSLDFSLNEEEHENVQDCPPGSVDISMLTTEEQNFAFAESELNSEIMAKVRAMDENLQDTESVIGDWLLSYSSVRSFNFGNLDPSSPKSMPELEGFHIDLAAEKRLSLPGDKMSLANIDLPNGRSERMSVLDKLCRYSTMITPLKESSEHKNHSNPDVYHPLPLDLQESMGLENTVPFSDENFKQLEDSYTLTREPSCMPPSLAQLDWQAGKPPCTPPVKKLGQSLSAHHSFEQHKIVNPELTCFRIDEDTCTSEENGTLDEVDDTLLECDDSRYSNSSSRRRPLVDTTNTETSVPKDVHERDSIASVNREPYMLRTQTDAKLNLRNTYGNDRGLKNDKENHSSAISVNGVEKVSKTHFSMEPRLLRKTSEENRLPSFSEKGRKPANIVSNVNSFIPLVQRKQQTTDFATGKRDVKIKALEAAEAAKRLEQKRDRDRKMKKEAAKIKRARLEEEKVKQLELKQRKEAEEQQKKEADMATKKRLREEQDRKEKERKRRCVEEARKEQKEQSKVRPEKEEKEQRRRAADVRLDKKKHLRNEVPKHQKPEKGSQIADVREKIKTGVRSVRDASETTKNVSEVHEDPEGLKEYDDKVASNLCNADAKNCLFTLSEGSGEQSYDISPYQASEDEDEEEHVIPKKKFMPSWAREKSLASIMPFMERVDPYGFFPLTRVCNISEFFQK